MARTTTRRTASSGVRRALGVAGTSGLVGGMALVGMGAIAAPHADAATVTKTLTAACNYAGTPLGTWTVQLTADIPTTLQVGAAFPAPKITAKVTTSTAAANTLRALDVQSLQGSSPAKYSVFGATQTANLTFPKTNVPASGKLVTTATGFGVAGTAPTKAGSYDVTVGDFEVQAWSTNSEGQQSYLGVPCKTDGDAAARKLTTITVTSAATSTTTTSPTSTASSTSSSSSTATSTSTTSEPTETTTTSEPTETTTTSEPTETTTTSEPTDTSTTTSEPTGTSTDTSSAPVVTPSTVQTGSVGSSGSGNMLTAAGIGMAAIGVVAVGGAVVAGRKREQQ